MISSSVFCPICGAKIAAKMANASSAHSFTCAFCAFERKIPMDALKGSRESLEHSLKDSLEHSLRDSLEHSLRDSHHLIKINPISTTYPKIYSDTMHPINLDPLAKNTPFKLQPLHKSDANIGCIWSPMTLPFQEDLAAFFQEKFRQLKHGGLLYLSTPVRRPFQNTPPLSEQINFFKAKNIMFLLEQHGFKMAWRKNRFSTTLKIIARKN